VFQFQKNLQVDAFKVRSYRWKNN